MTIDSLKKHITDLPFGPGIYVFKNAQKKYLYLGKATNLKNRVGSYLKTEDARIKKMVELAQSLRFISTQSEIEALILESQLIKRFRPQFNIVMRDDKQYAFVGFTREEYPKIFITHQPNSKHQSIKISSFIGPFTDVGALKITLRYLRRIFPYCTCRQAHHNYCLNYHIGKCPGFCCLKSDASNKEKKIYADNIKAIEKILSGKKNSFAMELKKEADNAARNDDFDKAIDLRDKRERLERIFENAKIIKYSDILKRYRSGLESLLKLQKPIIRIEGYDVSNIQGTHATGSMVTFVNGRPDKNFYRKFKIQTKQTPDDTTMLKEILIRRFKHDKWPFPDLILIDGGKAQLNTVCSVISSYYTMFLKKQRAPFLIALTKNKKHIGEKMYISGRKYPLALTKLSPADRNLFWAINSEAHRLAISYYRKLHQKLFKQQNRFLKNNKFR